MEKVIAKIQGSMRGLLVNRHYAKCQWMRVVMVAVVMAVGCLGMSGQVATYKTFKEAKENANEGELIYLDIDFCVVKYTCVPNVTIAYNLDDCDDWIVLTGTTLKDKTKSYHGITGTISNEQVRSKTISGFQEIERPALTILPKVVSADYVTSDHQYEFVRLDGNLKGSKSESSEITDANGKSVSVYIPSGSSVTAISNATATGLLNDLTSGTFGLAIQEYWAAGKEPERTVSVSVAEGQTAQGSVSVAAKGEAGSAAEVEIPDSQVATLKAVPADGYDFLMWTLNGKEFAAIPEYDWTVIGDAAFEAKFKKAAIPTYVITASASPEGLGSVKVNPSLPVEAGSKVTLEATAAANARFAEWVDEVGSIISTAPTAEIVATANAAYTAKFIETTTVNLSVEGNGTATLSCDGKLLEANQRVDVGSPLTITATPAVGWQLASITTSNGLSSTTSPFELTADANLALNVSFTEVPPERPGEIPTTLTSIKELLKYSPTGQTINLACDFYVMAKLMQTGQQMLLTDGISVILASYTGTDRPQPGEVITNLSGEYKLLSPGGAAQIILRSFDRTSTEQSLTVAPKIVSTGEVMTHPGEYVKIENVKLSIYDGLVYQASGLNSEKFLVQNLIDPDFQLQAATGSDARYTLTGLVGGVIVSGGESLDMLMLTEAPLLQDGFKNVSIKLAAQPADGGTVWVEQKGTIYGAEAEAAWNTEITLCATPAERMEFVGWVEGGSSDEPSCSQRLTVKALKTTSWTAIFKPKQGGSTEPDPSTKPTEPSEGENPTDPTPPDVKQWTVSFSTTDGGEVTVATASSTAVKSGEKVADGASVTISATAAEGYELIGLTVNGSPRVTDENGQLTLKVNANLVIAATFSRIIPTLNRLSVAVSDPIEDVEMGTVYIDEPGTTSLESAQMIVHHFHAEPAPDCKFVGWRSRNASLPFNTDPVFDYMVQAPLTLIAEFAYIIPAPRTITVATDNTKGAVTIKEFNATEATTRRYVTISATPASDRHEFVDWTDEAGLVVSTEPNFIYTASQSVNLTANFRSFYSLEMQAEGEGTVKAEADGVDDFSRIAEGTRVTLQITPESHYSLKSLSINGEDMTDAYLTSPEAMTVVMNGDKTIVATFAPVAYTISIAEHAHGSLEVVRGFNTDGSEAGGSVVHGDRARFNDVIHIYPRPHDGYRLTAITINGEQKIPAEGTAYVAHTIEGHTSLSAEFEKIPAEPAAIISPMNNSASPTENSVVDLQGRPYGILGEQTLPAGIYLIYRNGKWHKHRLPL